MLFLLVLLYVNIKKTCCTLHFTVASLKVLLDKQWVAERVRYFALKIEDRRGQNSRHLIKSMLSLKVLRQYCTAHGSK